MSRCRPGRITLSRRDRIEPIPLGEADEVNVAIELLLEGALRRGEVEREPETERHRRIHQLGAGPHSSRSFYPQGIAAALSIEADRWLAGEVCGNGSFWQWKRQLLAVVREFVAARAD